ncbi:ATPase [Candidatus Bipolaricaulota bacterium]|nr:ATPase [Candidatus Bipolaricaulota bacterium]
MAQKGIREFDAKRLLAKAVNDAGQLTGSALRFEDRLVLVTPETNVAGLPAAYPWLVGAKLVCKPDQLFGKRGKNNLLYVNKSFDEVAAWIDERMNKEVTIEGAGGQTAGTLTHFLIEPFVPHEAEYYLAFTAGHEEDKIHFSTQGGVDIESVWDTVVTIKVPVLGTLDKAALAAALPEVQDKAQVASFIATLYQIYVDYHFTYLEFNPITFSDGKLVPLDCVAKLDDTAAFQCAEKWGKMTFPKAFGSTATPEEAYIASLDEKTGASLKLTVLNPNGRVWPMVAGGGASVIYADTVVDLGFANELACYGEYSGDPSTELTYEYAKTLLDLMTRVPDPQGREKFLLIGGGIANFTDVAKTFTGIIQALKAYKDKLHSSHVKIFVRRGGPNYKEGLENIRRAGKEIGVPIEVYGPETHMTRIVSMALKGGNSNAS